MDEVGKNYCGMPVCFGWKEFAIVTELKYYPPSPSQVIPTLTQKKAPRTPKKGKGKSSDREDLVSIVGPSFKNKNLIESLKVYIPINCGDKFHWVLAIVILKERRIRVYDSMSRKRHFEPSSEIQKLVKILSTYLDMSGFWDQKVRTDWSTIEEYWDKIGNPFNVQYVERIANKPLVSLPNDGLDTRLLHKRYDALLWKYGEAKAQKLYTSDTKDPRPLKPNSVIPVKNQFRVFQLGVGASTEQGQGWRLLIREAESLGVIPKLQNCVASTGCRGHPSGKVGHPSDRLDYYIALGLTSCEGHPSDRLDQRGLYPWHGIDTLLAAVIGWTLLVEIRGMSVK
ncbi:hypothetical protein CQW23_01235 [Capsicum baccatum]|uniref:Ubiquitin-like protease family profile domain-containing protein n=1 Tax=Capsicum baccatum TaxID=33114 RepID=A0A2G2XN07_CAPBA|nr:hypothetical protein CQW23_01235 [Capsicum baccatum]